MNDRDDELRQAVALFRYGLIADLVHLPPGTAGIRQRLREKAERTYTIPGTRRTGVAAETMRDWLSVYRTGGFEALYPKSRADRGQPRRLSPELAEVNELIKHRPLGRASTTVLLPPRCTDCSRARACSTGVPASPPRPTGDDSPSAMPGSCG